LKSSNEVEYFILGKIVRPRGLQGEVKAEVYFHSPEKLPTFPEVFLELNHEWKRFKVTKSRLSNNFWYFFLEGIRSINEAETLRNAPIGLPASDLEPLGEDSYYHHQLRGLEVIDSEGNSLGKVRDVQNYSAADFILLEREETTLLPLSKSIIDRIDLEKKQIFLKIAFPS